MHDDITEAVRRVWGSGRIQPVAKGAERVKFIISSIGIKKPIWTWKKASGMRPGLGNEVTFCDNFGGWDVAVELTILRIFHS